jgi:hypothetical protein
MIRGLVAGANITAEDRGPPLRGLREPVGCSCHASLTTGCRAGLGDALPCWE